MDTFKLSAISVLLALALISGGCYVLPQYSVYQQRLSGEARFAEAESSRRIAILEAQAKFEAAKQLAQAEVERSKGVAEANKIIGDSLKGNDAYLRYLWIDGLRSDKSQIVYIPTEAGLPILEAGRTVHEQHKPE